MRFGKLAKVAAVGAVFFMALLTYPLWGPSLGEGHSDGFMADAQAAGGTVATGWSPTQPSPELGVYYPGTEALEDAKRRLAALKEM